MLSRDKVVSKVAAEVTHNIEIMPEELSPFDCMEKELAEAIDAEIEWNDTAWCMVKVTSMYKGFTVCDYIGGMSYASKEELEDSDIIADIKEGNTESIVDKIKGMFQELT